MTTLWFALAAALGNMAGAFAVVQSLRRELRVIDACLAFGAGFMLAVALLGVLPEVLREGEGGALYVLAGYLAVHLAQHVFTPHFHFGEETHRVSRSAGVSALIGLTLILLYKLNPRRVVGTDVFHAAVLLWTAGLARFASGNVDLALMATILVGSLPGVWIGTALVPHVPVVGLRHGLGIVLAAAALGVLSKAGVHVPPAVLVGVPLPLAAVSVAIHRRHAAQPTQAERQELRPVAQAGEW